MADTQTYTNGCSVTHKFCQPMEKQEVAFESSSSVKDDDSTIIVDMSPPSPLPPPPSSPATATSNASSYDEYDEHDELRLRSNAARKVTKILLPTAFGAIIIAPEMKNNNDDTYNYYYDSYAWVSQVGVFILWISVLLMMVGIYMQLKSPRTSNILERFGQLLCVVGLMFLQTPVIVSSRLLHPSCIWVPPFLVASILAAAMYFT